METTFEYNGKEITFVVDEGSQMISATQLAKAADKRLDVFEKTTGFSEFLKSLRKSQYFLGKTRESSHQMEVTDRIESNKKLDYFIRRTSNYAEHGTLYCEELALYLAMWIHADLAVWVMQCFSKMVFGKNAKAIKASILEIPEAFNMKEGLRSEMKELLKEILPEGKVKEFRESNKRLKELNGEIDRLLDKTAQLDLFDPIDNIGEEIRLRVIERNKLQNIIDKLDREFEAIKITDPEYKRLDRLFQKQNDRYNAAIEVLKSN